ncbi:MULTISPECIES: nitroreductase family protein [Lacrimispora]|jgi:nitroreductase|uniref:nitroreductase family protein n=1 Tax=Lacrimispora TaxID=2719231 RepID=UPI000BE33E96|nr:nitroreductase family protein [Lacrimispora amygdalina]MDK2964957.1 hypothetical protein [Lacrimispora sp.]
MDYEDVLRKRYSVRKYKDQLVEKEKLNKILEAGRLAPTAGNHQPQRILVVNSDEGIAKMQECTPCHFQAKLLFLVCYDKQAEHHNHYGDQRPYGEVDASIALTQMMLEAYNLGLGSVWVGLFNPELLRKNFDIPDHYEILGIMPVGYPDDEVEPSKMHYEKYPVEHTIFYNTYKR